MKTFITIFFLITSLFADIYKQSSLLGGGKMSYGSFGDTEGKLGKVDGTTAFVAGAKGSMTVADNFYVGGAGYGIGDEDPFKSAITATYGALIAGYTFFPSHLVHVNLEGLYGNGEFAENSQSSLFNLSELNLNMLINLSKKVKLALALGHREVQGAQNLNVEDDNINFSILFSQF